MVDARSIAFDLLSRGDLKPLKIVHCADFRHTIRYRFVFVYRTSNAELPIEFELRLLCTESMSRMPLRSLINSLLSWRGSHHLDLHRSESTGLLIDLLRIDFLEKHGVDFIDVLAEATIMCLEYMLDNDYPPSLELTPGWVEIPLAWSKTGPPSLLNVKLFSCTWQIAR